MVPSATIRPELAVEEDEEEEVVEEEEGEGEGSSCAPTTPIAAISLGGEGVFIGR